MDRESLARERTGALQALSAREDYRNATPEQVEKSEADLLERWLDCEAGYSRLFAFLDGPNDTLQTSHTVKVAEQREPEWGLVTTTVTLRRAAGTWVRIDPLVTDSRGRVRERLESEIFSDKFEDKDKNIGFEIVDGGTRWSQDKRERLPEALEVINQAWLVVINAEDTIRMLWVALRDPKLNPEAAARLPKTYQELVAQS